MKVFGVIIATGLLATALCSAASAHHYICKFCGNGIDASNMPQPGNSCQKNPRGKFHSWVMDKKSSLDLCVLRLGNKLNAYAAPKYFLLEKS